jgi:hypothetical protein
MSSLQEEPSSLTKSYKFIRRPDIPTAVRMKLGVLLVCFGYHGQVTQYAEKYAVSRSFLYGLKSILSEQMSGIFESRAAFNCDRSDNRYAAWKQILQFRLIGKCSLGAISELLSLTDDGLPNSTCFISQFLKNLGASLDKMVNWKGSVHYASDEIFMVGHQPILVTVDPVSSAILRMECLSALTKVAWEKHWEALVKAGIYPLGLVKDEGVIMNAAQQTGVMSQVAGQTDTFHAVSHRLGAFVERLQKAVDKAMEYEWARQDKIQSAVSPQVIEKRITLYEQARQQTLVAIEQFEGFQFLYFCIVNQFNIFDHQGQARQRQRAMEEVKIALEMMNQLGIAQLKEEIEKIEKLLPQLFDFLPKAQVLQYQLETELGTTQSYFWIYAWQKDKKSRKIKNYAKSQAIAQKANTALDLLEEHYQLSSQEFQALKRKIFNRLDSIVQSSALVETINSILRPYMNEARNQLSQEQLNIIRFYLNHRVYKRGKRKKFAPIELLTGKQLAKPWCDLLLDIAC